MIRISNIGQLVTMRGGSLNTIRDAEVHIEGTLLAYVGSKADAPPVNPVQEIDAGNRLVTPGLIDAHTHSVFGGNRAAEFGLRAAGASYEQIAVAGGGIKSTVASTRAASPEELVEAGSHNIRQMVRNGTTTLEIKSGYGLDPSSEAKMLTAAKRAGETLGVTTLLTFLGLHAVPNEALDRADYVSQVTTEDVYQTAWIMSDFADIFVEDGYFTPDDARALSMIAQRFGKPMRLHVDQLTDGNGAGLAAQLGAITADHLEYTNQDGIRAMASANVTPVLLPASVHGLGKTHYPDARAMIAAGLPVTLATDLNPGSSPCFSLPFCMNLAMSYMKMSLEECFRAVTTNAASSLKLGASHGQLEQGFNADLAIWDATSPEEIPYWIGAELANTVFASGKLIFSRTS